MLRLILLKKLIKLLVQRSSRSRCAIKNLVLGFQGRVPVVSGHAEAPNGQERSSKWIGVIWDDNSRMSGWVGLGWLIIQSQFIPRS